jgi:hypothetical protein
MEWAAGSLLRQDWPVDNQKLHRQAQARLDALVSVLNKENRKGDAQRMTKAAEEFKQRDMVITLTWAPGDSGPAGLDLEVKEPNGSVCSCLQRLTPGGGTLIGGTLSETNRETYVLAEGFTGDYQVTVRRIWGRPLGGKAKLVIVRHQDTAEESRQETVIRFDQKHTTKVKLTGGRRTSVADVPPGGTLRRPENNDQLPTSSQTMVKLRDLADPALTSSSKSGIQGGMGSLGGSSVARPGKTPLKRNQPEEVAYETKVSPFGANNVDMTAQAIVSADRRYVRLSVNAVFQTMRLGPLVNIPLIPGGGFNVGPFTR